MSTHSQHKLDPKKFSIATPKKGSSAYPRTFDTIGGVASSIEHIIYDTYDLLTSIKYIVEAEGCIIPDANNVIKIGRGIEGKLGGVRTKIMGERGC